MTKTIIFDYDGTIHHILGIYEPAFRETYQWLTEQKAAEEREIGSVEIAGWLGFNSKEMWNTFLPELDQSYKEQASRMVGELMVRQIRKHKAVWYPGAEEMLTVLKNRYLRSGSHPSPEKPASRSSQELLLHFLRSYID